MMLKMQENFYELYNDFVKRAMAKNRKYRQMLVNSVLPLDSKEMLSFIVSECLMEDMRIMSKSYANSTTSPDAVSASCSMVSFSSLS